MNHQGPSQVGPDLNLPLNPTEYFRTSVLPRYIRNPNSICSWARSRMPGFGPETFSDKDVADVVVHPTEMAFEKNHPD